MQISDVANKMHNANLPMVAELVVSKSKTNPEFIVKKPIAKETANSEVSPLGKTSYLVIRDYNRNGTINRFPLSTRILIQSLDTYSN